MKIIIFIAALSAILTVVTSSIRHVEWEASQYVDEICNKKRLRSYDVNIKTWNYESNVTKHNQRIKNKAKEEYAIFTKEIAMSLLQYNYEKFENTTLKRIIKNLVDIDEQILEAKDFREFNRVTARMQSNYAKVRIPSYDDESTFVQLEPEVTEIFLTSTDPDELKYYWTQWYDRAGTPCYDDFFKYVKLKNKAAQLNGYKDAADSWVSIYEDPTFEQQIENILDQLRPLYLQLHGYVRHKLYNFYGPEHIDLNKPIPMHLLGNIWGQRFDLGDKVKPFLNAPVVDTTAELIRQGYTPKKLFEAAEDFFLSINMTAMPANFWKNSIIEKPNDGRDMICHASAWDMGINNDVRIKQCTRVTMESFITVHHEMGHVEYYLQYKNQPFPFHSGANPGFHEAIGDTIALSVATPKHLNRVGLLDIANEDPQSVLNQQLDIGMQKLAFLPFAYVMDKFRYDVFRGNIRPENANCHFWRLRERYSGIGPATKRGNRDFDITAKYHASGDVEYMRYFVSNIIQFQFHKAACIKAGEYEPSNPAKALYNCDIYNSASAGNAIKEMLSLGSSKPWPDALEILTGERVLNADAILEYFSPLAEWLEAENNALGVNFGWNHSDEIDCPL